MLTIKNMSNALFGAFSVLQAIAESKGQSIKSLNINTTESDVFEGRIVGTVTVNNRSRRKFKLIQNDGKIQATLLGVTRQVA